MAKGLVKLKIIKKSEKKLDFPDNTHPPTDHFFWKMYKKLQHKQIHIYGFGDFLKLDKTPYHTVFMVICDLFYYGYSFFALGQLALI